MARVNTHISLRRLQLKLEKKNAELQKALGEIRTLQGIIPICSYCKRIRNDSGCWEQLEAYISSRSEALFSHGISEDCIGKVNSEILKQTEL